jgi:magnesium transporter
MGGTAHLGMQATDVPVVDVNNRFLSIVPARALNKILRNEHIEDVHRLSGILREDSQARDAVEGPSSILASDLAAASSGLLLPWILERVGIDPAFGSGPVASVIQDVLSLRVYFTTIVWLAV